MFQFGFISSDLYLPFEILIKLVKKKQVKERNDSLKKCKSLLTRPILSEILRVKAIQQGVS